MNIEAATAVATSKNNLSNSNKTSLSVDAHHSTESDSLQATNVASGNLDELESRIKAGIVPLFLTTATQELFKIKPNEHLNPEKPFRFIPKADLISDMNARLAISDFHPAKQQILDFGQEEILVHHDPEFKYGQNYFIVVTNDALDALLKPADTVTSEDEVKVKKQRKWECLGTDKEMESESTAPTREKIALKASRKLKHFNSSCKFGDRDAHDGFMECRPFRDQNYEVSKVELSIGVQTVSKVEDKSMQTTWHRPKNFCVQYEPNLMSEAEQKEILESNELSQFLRAVIGRFENVMLHNSMIDIFTDHYVLLGEEDMGSMDQGSQAHLQQYQSFTDLKHSKDKSISCIDWHPTQKGVLAISCVQRSTFDERLDHGPNRSGQSLILIWSFHDPIHPQLILEAPDDIQCFRFNPVDPNLLVGGCVNGQVVLWDISDHQDKIKMNRRSKEDETGSRGHNRQAETSVIRWLSVSSIEGSHRGAVSDVWWMAEGMELSHSGEYLEAVTESSKQLMTVSLDGSVYFWDTRYKKELKGLDLTWKPFLRVPLSSLDNTYDYGLMKMAVKADSFTPEKSEQQNGLNSKMKLPMEFASSKFFAATEEGDLIQADWSSEKQGDEKAQASRVEHAYSCHFGPISDLRRSPFFPDIILSVGGWAFHVWKEKDATAPLLSSAPSSSYAISGVWSPTRPGVFFISRADGTIEIWDLMDRSHAPSAVQNISSTAISSLAIHQYQGKSRNYHQFIAAGDDEGTLHILEIPRNLTKSMKNERGVIKAFFEREERRVGYVKDRRDFRQKEKAKYDAELMEATALANASAAAQNPAVGADSSTNGSSNPPVKNTKEGGHSSSEGEVDKLEAEYIKMEKAFLEMEGLLQRD